MKNSKTLLVVVLIVIVLCLIGGVYSLVMSILGRGDWCLSAALLLIAVGNGLTYYSNKKLRKK